MSQLTLQIKKKKKTYAISKKIQRSNLENCIEDNHSKDFSIQRVQENF